MAGLPRPPCHSPPGAKALRTVSLVLSLGALTACTDPVSVALGGASVVSVVQTGKTISDHAMSVATGMDCSIRHTFAGTSWCQPVADEMAQSGAELYCYRSIADITCYKRDNPHETESRRTR